MTRIAKIISNSGLCSRRDAEKLILSGKVSINDVIISSPATIVCNQDVIKVEGKIISQAKKKRIWLYYKPPGIITTHKDPQGRPTVFEEVAKKLGTRVISVGRLDLQSEGLLILTNSSEFAREMELPSNKIERKYRVKTFGNILLSHLEQAKNGIVIDGIKLHFKEVELIKNNGLNSELIITLTEGKNREIRNILGYFEINIKKLIRTEYGPFKLGTLKPGEILEIHNVPGK
jgi:23S rRNA pseudouridine2605 synthase